MAINKKNNIRTDIKINSSGAVKGATRLFDKLKKGQKDVTKGATTAAAATKKVGKSAASAGKSGGAGMGMFSKGLKAAKTGVLSMIPALGGLTTAIAATGIGALLIAVAALGIGMLAAVKKGAQFGKALSTLQGISGGTNRELAALSKQAKALGASTSFTATEVLELQTELAKLGFTAADIQQATPAVLDLAASLGVGLAESAELAGSLVRSFGLETKDTQRIVDVLAASATGSAQSFGTLVESFAKAAPSARALGVSIEETSAYLGALTNNGLKGSVAGTGLSKTFIELHKKGMTLEEGMNKVRNSSDQLTTAIDLVGVIGGKSLLTLANSAEDIKSLKEQMDNAAGAAKALADIKLDNLSGDVTKMGSAWEGLLLSLEDGTGVLNNLSRKVIQGLTSALTGLTTGLQFVDFTVKELEQRFSGFGDAAINYLIGSFLKLQGNIKMFSVKARMAISDIPIIGKSIDKDRIKKDLADAANLLKAGSAALEAASATEIGGELGEGSMSERFKKYQEGEQLISAAKAKARADEAAEEETKAQATADAEKLRIKNAEDFVKFKQDLTKKQADYEADTEEKKIELARERQIAALEALNQNAAEEQLVKDEINAMFDAKQKEREDKKKELDDEKAEVKRQADADKQLELDALELERVLLNDQLTFDERIALQQTYLDQKLANDLDNEKLTQKEIELLNKKAEKAKEKVRKTEADASKKLKDKVLNDALDGAAESFGIAQEVAVAKMIMAAPEAVAGSFKEAAKAYAPPLSLAMGALGAVGTIAPIIKGLSDIKKTRFSKGGKSGGGGGGGSISPSIATAPAAAAGISSDTISSLGANNSARLGVDPSLGGAAGASAANNVLGGSSSNVVFSESSYQSFQNQVGFVEDLTTVGGD